jgi:hypothetical protein
VISHFENKNHQGGHNVIAYLAGKNAAAFGKEETVDKKLRILVKQGCNKP